MTHRSTKDAIVATGARIMMEKGYNHTGLQQVLKEAGVPKGSFYHYFGSKEDFGLAVVDRYVEDFDELFAVHLDRSERPPLERLKTFFEAGIERHRESGCWGGCLMGNLGQELSDQKPVFRDRVAVVLDSWRGHIATCVEEAAGRGELRGDPDPQEVADFVLDSWEGAVLRMKVTKSVHPLERFVDFVFGTILQP